MRTPQWWTGNGPTKSQTLICEYARPCQSNNVEIPSLRRHNGENHACLHVVVAGALNHFSYCHSPLCSDIPCCSLFHRPTFLPLGSPSPFVDLTIELVTALVWMTVPKVTRDSLVDTHMDHIHTRYPLAGDN